MPAQLNIEAARRRASELASAGGKLARAGLNEKLVCAWYGVPAVSDVRYVTPPKRASRRALGGWIAALVAGEAVEEKELGVLDGKELDALEEAGWIARAGGKLTANVSVVPVRGALVGADRFDDRSPNAVGSPDVSAWNLAASLPSGPRALLDVGAGAGTASLVAAKRGARVIGTDIDGRALEMATVNALVNDVRAVFLEGDLFAGVDEKFDVVAFNAPLARAELAIAGGAPLYMKSPRGEKLIVEFLEGARARVADGGELLCHAQLTPAVSGTAQSIGIARKLELHFADAPDGTPHGLISLRDGVKKDYARVRTPLGPALPHLHREVVDRLHATRDALDASRDDFTAVILRPPPWLQLLRVYAHDGAVFREREVRLGAHRLDSDEVRSIEACNGRSVGALVEGLDEEEWDRLRWLADRGLLVV